MKQLGILGIGIWGFFWIGIASLVTFAAMSSFSQKSNRQSFIPPYPTNTFVIKLDIPPIQSNEDSAGSMIVADLDNDGRMD